MADKDIDEVLGGSTVQRTEQDEVAAVETDDFEQEPPQVTDPVSEAAAGEAPVEPVDPHDYRQDAEALVSIMDSVAIVTLPPLYRLAALTREQRQQIKAIERKVKKPVMSTREDGTTELVYGSVNLTDEEKEIWQIHEALEDLNEIVPLSQEETEKIVDPMTRVLQKYKVKVGPEAELAGVMMAVYGLRFAPLLQRIFR